MSKSWSLAETSARYDRIFVCSDNHEQNVWKKVSKKPSKLGED